MSRSPSSVCLAASPACVDDAVTTVAEGVAGDEGGRCHHVDPSRQYPDEMVDIGPHWVVYDAVGLQLDECINVVGRRDAERLDTGQYTDVVAHLVGRPGVAPH